MKVIFIFGPFIFLLFISCSGEQNGTKQLEVSSEYDTTIIAEIEDTVPIDTEGTTSAERSRSNEAPQLNQNLINLLNNPLDLVAYKAEYGPSNSGYGGDETLFDTPDTTGFMYQYMLFNKLMFIIEPRLSEGDLFNRFRIKVFMYGESVGRFSDNNEELMAIECAINNNTLGELDIYGLTESRLVSKFGEPQYTQDDIIIYAHENKVLSIHLEVSRMSAEVNHMVDWFKYARLNKSIDLDTEIPDYLLNF